MRKISANYILPVNGPLLKNGIITIDNEGTITDIIDTKGQLKEIPVLEFYNGIIVPGFINSHCHIDLSHLKEQVPAGRGMFSFFRQLKEKRNSLPEHRHEIIKNADSEMKRNGIVAVGDISNGDYSFPIKSNSEIYYHTFIEIFGIDDSKTNKLFLQARELFEKYYSYFNNNSLTNASINPHSSITVSPLLFQKIFSDKKYNEIISIHNQESENEQFLFSSKTGELYDFMKKAGADYSWINTSVNSSLINILQFLPDNTKTILVHNSYTTENDIKFAEKHFTKDNLFWAFCPGSNLYIGNKLPDIVAFIKYNQNICIGTDSLASNKTLSILDELKILTNYYPDIPFQTLMKWATMNGAKALNIEKKYGSIEIGKKPGLNLIKNFDFQSMNIQNNSYIEVLV